jgi:hypothetical protein
MSADLGRASPSEPHVHCGQQNGSGLGHCCRLWVLSCVVWWGLGWAIGGILDAVLWQFSFNYLYSPQEFVRRFSLWSVAAATIVAAAATTGRGSPARLFSILRLAGLCALLTLTLAIAWGGGAAWFAETESNSAAVAHLAPLRRVRFCTGLWKGAVLGFGVGTLLTAAVLGWNRRRLSDVPNGRQE